jgi:hypothetical protein
MDGALNCLQTILRATKHLSTAVAEMDSEKHSAEYRPLREFDNEDVASVSNNQDSRRPRSASFRIVALYISLLLNALLAMVVVFVVVRFPTETTCIQYFNEACTFSHSQLWDRSSLLLSTGP